jgi:hypothetical protein
MTYRDEYKHVLNRAARLLREKDDAKAADGVIRDALARGVLITPNDISDTFSSDELARLRAASD